MLQEEKIKIIEIIRTSPNIESKYFYKYKVKLEGYVKEGIYWGFSDKDLLIDSWKYNGICKDDYCVFINYNLVELPSYFRFNKIH